MPILLSVKFDGGAETYVKGIDKSLKELTNWVDFWDRLINEFEGKGEFQSPIIEIWDTEGACINGNWGATTLKYEEWKGKNWQGAREVDVPFSSNLHQVLSGNQLKALLDGGHVDAVREKSAYSMAYGVNNDYSDRNQERFKILDVYPNMETIIDRTMVRWMQKKAPELEIVE